MSTTILAFLATIVFLYFAKNIFIPIVLGVFLYFLLDPIVEKIERKYFPRVIVAPLLVTIVVGLLSLGSWVTFITTAEISSHVPEYSEKVKNLTGFFISKAENIAESTTKLFPEQKDDVKKVEVVQSMGDITSHVLKWLDEIVGIIGSIFMVPILTLFFLLERNRLREKLSTIPFLAHSGKELANKTARVVQGFFIGNLIGGVASTICFFAGFALIGLENNVPLSIGAGFLNLVPIVGAFLAMVFPLAQGLLQFNSFTPFLTIILASLGIHFLIGNLVLPKLMGSRLDLNITAATIGMLFWGWLWGAMGIFLAVPLMAVIKVFCSLSPKTKPLEILLSESSTRPSAIILVGSLKSLKMMSTSQGVGIEHKIDADRPISQ